MTLQELAALYDRIQRCGWQTPKHKLLERCRALLAEKGYSPILAQGQFETGVRALAIMIVNLRGLYLTGGVGTGKTTFFKAIARTDLNGFPFSYINLKIPSDVERINRFNPDNEISSLLQTHILIDDLGSEGKSSHYGTYPDVAIDFMMECMGKQPPGLTFSFSTNLTGAELVTRYSGRLDCLKDYVHPVSFNGKSKRSWNCTQRDLLEKARQPES